MSTQVGIIFVVDVSDQSVGLAKQDERVRVYVATVLPEIVAHIKLSEQIINYAYVNYCILAIYTVIRINFVCKNFARNSCVTVFYFNVSHIFAIYSIYY